MAWKSPPKWMLKRILRQTAKLVKVTIAETNDEYGQGVESQVIYTINHCEIQQITSEDLRFMPAGVLKEGDARGFIPFLVQETKWLHELIISGLYTFDSNKVIISNGIGQLLNSGTLAVPIFPTDNPTIVPIEEKRFTALPYKIIIKENKPASTEIKYILSINGGSTWLYWNGSNWVTSNGTYSQASISSDIETNFSTFVSEPGDFKWKAFLHTDDTTVSPSLEAIEAKFGVEVETEDYIIDQKNIKYRVTRVTNYYERTRTTKEQNLFLKEVYLKRVTGE